MHNIWQLPIRVHWNVLEAVGIEKTMPVTARPEGVTFEKASRTVLRDVGGERPLGFIISEGVVEISTKKGLSPRTSTRAYDIRHFVVSAMEEAGEDDSAPTLAPAARIQKIITIIADTVDPSSWRVIAEDSGEGQIGSIREMHGQLIVTQTSENHWAIGKVLAKPGRGTVWRATASPANLPR